MTEDRLQKLTSDLRKLNNLTGWLLMAERAANPNARLEALLQASEVGGWLSANTVQKCIDLILPELKAAHEKLETEWDRA